MKAEQLRIGNLVNFFDDDTMFTVTEIGSSGIGVENKEESTWIELDRFAPIELTEEWLIKAGFIYIDEDNEFLGLKHHYENLMVSDSSTGFSVVTYKCKVLKEVDIKTVHQLQNLYFALTNQELTFSEQL